VLQVWLEARAGAVQVEGGCELPETSAQSTVRVWVPPPQLTVHVPQSPVVQCEPVQGSVLQAFELRGAGGLQKARDTLLLPTEDRHSTTAVCVPFPHAILHVDQGPVLQV